MQQDIDANPDHSWERGLIISASVLAVSLLYVFIRYNFLRDVPYADIPLFIFNKSIALGSTVTIGISFLIGPLAVLWPRKFAPHIPLRKSLGVIGFGGAVIHGFISIILLSPRYYPKFYAVDGAVNAVGQFALLFGVLGLAVFTIVAISSLPVMYERLGEARWRKMQRLGLLGNVFCGIFKVRGLRGLYFLYGNQEYRDYCPCGPWENHPY